MRYVGANGITQDAQLRGSLFLDKKRYLMTSNFVVLLKDNKFSFWLKAIAASLVQIKKQCWIVKRIFSDSLQKNVLLAISFSFLETRAQFLQYLNVITWRHLLI